jgi:hypothetical protein
VGLDEIVERLGGRSRREAEFLAQPRGVDHPAVHEEVDLVQRYAAEARRGLQERLDYGKADAARAAYGLRERDHARAGDVEGTRMVLHDRSADDLQCVIDVHELQSRVAAEDGGHDPLSKIAQELCLRGRSGERGEPQHRAGHVRPPTLESAHVSLDVEDVAAVAAARHIFGPGVLGEDSGVTERGTIGGGR